jgi:hypothetical protein
VGSVGSRTLWKNTNYTTAPIFFLLTLFVQLGRENIYNSSGVNFSQPRGVHSFTHVLVVRKFGTICVIIFRNFFFSCEPNALNETKSGRPHFDSLLQVRCHRLSRKMSGVKVRSVQIKSSSITFLISVFLLLMYFS